MFTSRWHVANDLEIEFLPASGQLLHENLVAPCVRRISCYGDGNDVITDMR